MDKLIGQVLGGTKLDQQGEKLSKDFLDDFCRGVDGQKLPLHQHHDVAKETVGYFENLRLVECTDEPNEWLLVADVYAKKGFLDGAIGGFSISGFELIYSPASPDYLLYLPFPEYNQQELLSYFKELGNVQLNKWIKKSAEPLSSTLFIAAMSIVVTPIWNDVYKHKIAPKISLFMTECWPKLRKKNLTLEHVQVIDYKGQEIQVRFIGEKGKELFCYSSLIMEDGLKVAIKSIDIEYKNHDPIMKIVLVYNYSKGGYQLFRIEYSSGEVVHFA